MEALFAQIEASLASTRSGFGLILPELVLVGTILVLIVGAALDKKGRWLPWISLTGILASSILLLTAPVYAGFAWGGMILIDQIGSWSRGILLFVGFITILWIGRDPKAEFRSEAYAMLVTLLLGTMFMSISANLLFMYLSLELVSISSYLLTVHRREDRSAAEASMKYIIFGAFSSALMLYGISWIYGLTGSLELDTTAIEALNNQPLEVHFLVLGLMLGGIMFKIAAVPMHFWAPDIYQGATFPVATYFSIVPKAGGILMLVHLLKLTEELHSFQQMQLVMLALALASMTLGNLAALWQNDLKRLLAYSSIAQSGFMLVASAARTETGEAAVLFYLTIYTLMNLSVFIIAAGLARVVQSDDLRKLDGLAMRFPISTIAITIGLVALVGLPPTSGFIAKWYVLMSGIGQTEGEYSTFWVITLAMAVINTVISLFYYLRIPARMVLRTAPEGQVGQPMPLWIWLGIVMAIPTLVLGIMGFDEIMNLIQLGLWNPGTQ